MCTSFNQAIYLTEIYHQVEVVAPFIDCESTWSFERTARDNSPEKYVLNGEYWLIKCMADFVKLENYDKIIDAYKYLIRKVVEYYGKH